MKKTILIVGGGFGGVRCALDLARANLPEEEARIVLLSDKPHFEYTPSLYKVATGCSPLEVCIPLREIFSRLPVEVCTETVSAVNLSEKELAGASGLLYRYDFLVLALGSETTFFGIDGLEAAALTFKTLTDALRLNWHLVELFQKVRAVFAIDQTVPASQIVVIGGGYSGVELASAIAEYRESAARRSGFDPSLITINLIEACPRILGTVSKRIAIRIIARLNRLGVNIITDRRITKEDIESADFFPGTVSAKTLIWTAGICPNALYRRIDGFSFDKSGRVIIDRFLQAKGRRDVFVIGDGAATRWSGMAQTALYDGRYVARVIRSLLEGRRPSVYRGSKPVSVIPVGEGWAAAIFPWATLYGFLGWFLREAADLRFFLSVLSPLRALRVWRSGMQKVESNNMNNV